MKPIPKTVEEIKELPAEAKLEKEIPDKTIQEKEQPLPSELEKEVPSPSELSKETPPDKPLENCVKIGGELIEIKPTKLKYFRNKMASAYSLLKTVPLNELLSYGKGVMDATKDADKILFDFLVATFDDSSFVTRNYDEMTADDVEQIFKIFGRLNHIDEKEEAIRKNREAQQAKH